MNDNIYIAVKALADFENFWQSTKLELCETKMPIFGQEWGDVPMNFVANIFKTFPPYELINSTRHAQTIARN